MKNLHLTDEKAEKMDEVETLALDTVKSALNENISADDDIVKVAVKTLGFVAKNRQTLTGRSAIEWSMISYIGTEKEMKKYIGFTTPQVQKALGSKK